MFVCHTHQNSVNILLQENVVLISYKRNENIEKYNDKKKDERDKSQGEKQ